MCPNPKAWKYSDVKPSDSCFFRLVVFSSCFFVSHSNSTLSSSQKTNLLQKGSNLSLVLSLSLHLVFLDSCLPEKSIRKGQWDVARSLREWKVVWPAWFKDGHSNSSTGTSQRSCCSVPENWLGPLWWLSPWDFWLQACFSWNFVCLQIVSFSLESVSFNDNTHFTEIVHSVNKNIDLNVVDRDARMMRYSI